MFVVYTLCFVENNCPVLRKYMFGLIHGIKTSKWMVGLKISRYLFFIYKGRML
jgi:hypothetical protein